MTKNEYEEQVQEFLKKTGTEFSTKFVEFGCHFEGEQEKRDIYEITLKRGNRLYKFKYGQPIKNSGLMLFHLNGERTNHKGFEVPKEIRLMDNKKLQSGEIRRWFTDTHFSLNGLKYELGKDPTAYDVLSCLQTNEVDTFKEFCMDFGYDTDSRTAEKTYKLVKQEYSELCKLYNEKELRMMEMIQ